MPQTGRPSRLTDAEVTVLADVIHKITAEVPMSAPAITELLNVQLERLALETRCPQQRFLCLVWHDSRSGARGLGFNSQNSPIHYMFFGKGKGQPRNYNHKGQQGYSLQQQQYGGDKSKGKQFNNYNIYNKGGKKGGQSRPVFNILDNYNYDYYDDYSDQWWPQ
eukprot:3736773-Amphidinium_carterae.1